MTGVRVRVEPPTDAGRLYPRYERDAGVLAIESRVTRLWPHGLVIDGLLVCDLDEHGVLANVDLNVPMKRWPRVPEIDWPADAVPGNVVFEPATLTERTSDLPVDVRADEAAHLVEIRFGGVPTTRAIAVSDDCVALLHHGELAGFVVRLSGEE